MKKVDGGNLGLFFLAPCRLSNSPTNTTKLEAPLKRDKNHLTATRLHIALANWPLGRKRNHKNISGQSASSETAGVCVNFMLSISGIEQLDRYRVKWDKRLQNSWQLTPIQRDGCRRWRSRKCGISRLKSQYKLVNARGKYFFLKKKNKGKKSPKVKFYLHKL